MKPRKNSLPPEEFINNGIKGDCLQIFHYGVYNPVIKQHISSSWEAFLIFDDHYQFIQKVWPNDEGYFRVQLKPGTYFIFTLNKTSLKNILEKRTSPHKIVKVQVGKVTYVTLKTEIYGC